MTSAGPAGYWALVLGHSLVIGNWSLAFQRKPASPARFMVQGVRLMVQVIPPGDRMKADKTRSETWDKEEASASTAAEHEEKSVPASKPRSMTLQQWMDLCG